MRLLYGHDAEVAHWLAEQIPYLRPRIPYFPLGQVLGPTAAIGVLDDAGTLIAGVAYHNWDPFVGNIEVSCAAITPRWANRAVFSALLRYPFDQLKVTRCTAVTPRRSPPGATSPRKFLEFLGFVREGSIRLGFGDQNAIVYGLLADEWRAGPFRWRGGLTDGQEVGTHAAAGA